MKAFVPVLMCTCILLSGCGKQEPPRTAPASAADRAPAASAPSPSPTVARVLPISGSVAEASSPAELVSPVTQDEMVVEDSVLEIRTNTLVLALATLRAMERDAQFAEALNLGRQLEDIYRDHADVGSLHELVLTLAEEKRAYVELAFAARNAGSDDPTTSQIARDKLSEGGEVARLVARKLLRQEQSPRILKGCASFLVEYHDVSAMPIILERFMEQPGGGLDEPLLEGLPLLEKGVPAVLFFRFLKFAEPRLKDPGAPDYAAIKKTLDLLIEKMSRVYQSGVNDEATPDGNLNRLIAGLAASSFQKGDTGTVSKLMDIVLKDPPTSAVTIPDRFDSLLQRGVPPRLILSLYRPSFYFLIKEGDPEKLRQMTAVGEKLSPLLENDDNRAQLKSMALDAAFVTGNYQEGLRILESGVPNQEPEWIELAINKVKALIAVQEGRPKDAIGFYRKVMDVIARDNKSQNDPSTGVQHTREMILGLHAKKIADLWVSQKNEKEAAKAYQEARRYYEAALNSVAPDSREAELIKSELAGIPK